MSVLKQVVLNISHASLRPSNDNSFLTSITSKIKTDVRTLTSDEIEYIKKIGNDIISNDSNSEKKADFIIFLCKILKFPISERLFTDNGYFLNEVFKFLGVSEEDFDDSYFMIYYDLITHKNLDLMIKVLMSLLDLSKTKGILTKINDELEDEFESLIRDIKENGNITERVEKKGFFYFLEMMVDFGEFQKLSEEYKNIFFDYLIVRYLENIKDSEYYEENEPTLVSRNVVKSEDETLGTIDEINFLLSNGNFTSNPLIVTFNEYPGDNTKIIVYKGGRLSSSEQSSDNTTIFEGDKEGFLKELISLNSSFCKKFKTGNIFVISVYRIDGGKATPPKVDGGEITFPENYKIAA